MYIYVYTHVPIVISTCWHIAMGRYHAHLNMTFICESPRQSFRSGVIFPFFRAPEDAGAAGLDFTDTSLGVGSRRVASAPGGEKSCFRWGVAVPCKAWSLSFATLGSRWGRDSCQHGHQNTVKNICQETFITSSNVNFLFFSCCSCR